MGEDKFGYEDLEVWQKAIDWASEIVSLSGNLETSRKHLRLIEQLESSSSSVAMNIAEGKEDIHRRNSFSSCILPEAHYMKL